MQMQLLSALILPLCRQPEEPLAIRHRGGGAAIAQSITEPTRLPHASFKHVWTLFYQHLTMHCLFLPVFTNVLYFYMNVISSTPLLRIFYSLSNHNYNRIRTARQYLESLAHPTGMHFNGRHGRKGGISIILRCLLLTPFYTSQLLVHRTKGDG